MVGGLDGWWWASGLRLVPFALLLLSSLYEVWIFSSSLSFKGVPLLSQPKFLFIALSL